MMCVYSHPARRAQLDDAAGADRADAAGGSPSLVGASAFFGWLSVLMIRQQLGT